MLPFDVETVHIEVSKHFRNTWMRRWGWTHDDLRSALQEAYRVTRVGRRKWEVMIRKRGGRKLVIVYEAYVDEVFIITGAEG